MIPIDRIDIYKPFVPIENRQFKSPAPCSESCLKAERSIFDKADCWKFVELLQETDKPLCPRGHPGKELLFQKNGENG